MHKIRIGLILLAFVCFDNQLVSAQRRKAEPFDVQHYKFDVRLDDKSDSISVDAIINIIYDKEVPPITILDLADRTNTNYGMLIRTLIVNGEPVDFVHNQDQVKITTPKSITTGDTAKIEISYSGRPDNGLVIIKNFNGTRTYFAEHWPNRAHRWLPVIDHPSEKATCEFLVTAPAQYEVVSNGDRIDVKIISEEEKQTIWKMDQPIPSKVMVIGVADFKTHVLDEKKIITAWVYDKPGNKAIMDFEDTPKIFELLVEKLGEYPFSKCDQVESTTRFGGMENAGNIFYPGRLLNGRKNLNHTIAHEIAHQWFGNAVSEADWEDVWISEGIATFLEYYYVLNIEGEQALLSKLAQDEQKILNYQYRFPAQTIVQRNFDVLENILNPMVYEKAAWMLRMLQQKMGEEQFFNALLTFYEKYKFNNASTEDFVAIAKNYSPVPLDDFFQQWLYVPGTPDLEYKWKYKNGKLILEFYQKTPYEYQLDIPVMIKYGGQTNEIKLVSIDSQKQIIEIKCEKPSSVLIDPLNLIPGEFARR